MKKYLKKIVVTVALAVSCFSLTIPGLNVSANTDSGNDDFVEKMEQYQDHSTVLGKSEKSQLVEKVKEGIQNQDINVVGDVDQLDYDNSNAFKFDANFENVTSITIPYKDTEGVKTLSGLTVTFDAQLNQQEYSEIQVTETKTQATSFVYINGSEAGSATIEKSSRFQTMGYIDRVNDCMARFGVNPDTAALALTTCGTVCAISLGTLCLPCLGIFGAAGGGVIVGCFLNS
ncbi:hypothetical protein [Heyndrickxia oleronia]|uniref:Uncharacterized protein n=2 Tax=Heyndrickxia oleronia TaxID=38875 RepID=A0AAW6T4H2_9BACI|nr:hypothetical protein [Heyndrickxia oleronia]MDH5164477.1 hypothetical protein [Heyndrickxia oleronia]GIN41469.1 hypothetical protein J19TS1_44180 [Heyndrickxia oleronia]